MRQGLESQPIPLPAQHTKVNITASFGVTGILGGEASADELIRWADDALYKAKNNGRNQVIIHE